MSTPGAAVFEGAQWSQPVALGNITGAVALDFTASNRYEGTLVGNVTFANPSGNIPAQLVGQTLTLVLTQDGTGSRTAAFGSAYIVPAGFTLSTAAGSVDIVRLDFISNGTVRVSLNAQTTEATIDTLTVNAIVGGDASLGITGQAAAQGGAVAITGGTSSTSANAGGAVTLTGGTAGLTGVGGGVTITSGAGGATSGAAGAVAITAGAATSAAGASVTITAGAGGGGTNAGGNINLVPGAAVSTGVPGEVEIAGSTAGMIPVALNYTAALVTQGIFVASRAYRVKSIIGRTRVAGSGGACTIAFFKAPSGTAVGSGTALHSGSFDLVGTADTNQTLTLSTTVATVTLAAGDSIGYVLTGTATSAVGNVTVTLVPV